MKNCVLLTDSFPYGLKEPFLESEIHYISKCFEKIYIFSLSYDKITRKVPNNVHFYSLHISNMKNKRFRKFIAGFKSNNMKINTRNILDVLICLYYRGGVNIACKNIKKILKDNNIDIYNSVIYTYWSGFLSNIAIQLSKSLGLNSVIVSRAHGADLYDYRNKRGFAPFQDYTMQNITYISPISLDGMNYLLNKYPQYQNKIILHRLGTKDYGFKTTDNKSIFNVVSCSNIIPLKRLPLILNSLVKAKDRIQNIHWYCFGDGEDLAKLKKECEYLGFNNNATFFGRVKNEDIYNFYLNNQVDLFINASEVEGIPVSIMEALSFGVPCIATDVGGMREIINNTNGILISKDSNADYICKEIISYYMKDEKAKKEYRKNARKHWERYFNSNKNFTEWSCFLSSLRDEK